MKPEEQKIKVWQPFLIGLAAAIGLLAGHNMNFNNSGSSMFQVIESGENSNYGPDGRVEEILRFIETNYVDSLNSDLITIEAIRHILKDLDPHSDYITEEERNSHNERMEGSYRGIGIETLKYNDTFYITKIIEGAPSAIAGLNVGDAIISVSGELVSGNDTSFDNIRSKLKNEGSEEVVLEVQPLNLEELKEIIVKVKDVELPSANVCFLIEPNTIYLQLARFSGNTYEQFVESLDSITVGNESYNLILDLRNNPGGFLPEAIKILSQLFTEKDRLLTYTEGLNRKKAEYRSTGKTFFNLNKIAILMNEYSASGSEILAGAIQDWDRGIVIGKESFGKGLVQEIFPLNNGGALRLTVAKYYTPTGRLIQKPYNLVNRAFEPDSFKYKTRLLNRRVEGGNGIKPDVIVESLLKEECSAYLGFSDFFAIHLLKKSKGRSLTRDDIHAEDFKDFLESEFGVDPNEYDSNCIDSRIFDSKLDDSILEMVLGSERYLEDAFDNDPYILEALKFTSDKRTTMAYLSKEE